MFLAGESRSLAAYALAVSDPRDRRYGHYLTPEQTRARFGPAQHRIDVVSEWLRGTGLSIVSAGSRAVVAQARSRRRPRRSAPRLRSTSRDRVPDGLPRCLGRGGAHQPLPGRLRRHPGHRPPARVRASRAMGAVRVNAAAGARRLRDRPHRQGRDDRHRQHRQRDQHPARRRPLRDRARRAAVRPRPVHRLRPGRRPARGSQRRVCHGCPGRPRDRPDRRPAPRRRRVGVHHRRPHPRLRPGRRRGLRTRVPGSRGRGHHLHLRQRRLRRWRHRRRHPDRRVPGVQPVGDRGRRHHTGDRAGRATRTGGKSAGRPTKCRCPATAARGKRSCPATRARPPAVGPAPRSRSRSTSAASCPRRSPDHGDAHGIRRRRPGGPRLVPARRGNRLQPRRQPVLQGGQRGRHEPVLTGLRRGRGPLGPGTRFLSASRTRPSTPAPGRLTTPSPTTPPGRRKRWRSRS